MRVDEVCACGCSEFEGAHWGNGAGCSKVVDGSGLKAGTSGGY